MELLKLLEPWIGIAVIFIGILTTIRSLLALGMILYYDQKCTRWDEENPLSESAHIWFMNKMNFAKIVFSGKSIKASSFVDSSLIKKLEE